MIRAGCLSLALISVAVSSCASETTEDAAFLEFPKEASWDVNRVARLASDYAVREHHLKPGAFTLTYDQVCSDQIANFLHVPAANCINLEVNLVRTPQELKAYENQTGGYPGDFGLNIDIVNYRVIREFYFQ